MLDFHGSPLDCVVRALNDRCLSGQKLELPRCQLATNTLERSLTIASVNCNSPWNLWNPCPNSQEHGTLRTRSLYSHSKAAGLIWMPKPIAAIALYEMTNLRLKPNGAMNSTTKRKPALMVETQKNFWRADKTRKECRPLPIFCFQGSNNQNKGPTRPMRDLKLVFSRRSRLIA